MPRITKAGPDCTKPPILLLILSFVVVFAITALLVLLIFNLSRWFIVLEWNCRCVFDIRRGWKYSWLDTHTHTFNVEVSLIFLLFLSLCVLLFWQKHQIDNNDCNQRQLQSNRTHTHTHTHSLQLHSRCAISVWCTHSRRARTHPLSEWLN